MVELAVRRPVGGERAATRSSRLILLGLFVVYTAAVWWSYRDVVAPAFTYQGLGYTRPPLHTVVATVALLAVAALVTPPVIRRPSHLVLLILLFLVVVPCCIVPACSPSVDGAHPLRISGMIVVGYGLTALAGRLPLLPLRPKEWRVTAFWPAVTVVAIGLYGIIFATYGLHFRVLVLSDVYDLRATFKEQGSRLGAYAVGWQGNVVNPLLLSHGLLRRRWAVVVAAVAGQVAIYSVTGFKSVLFSGLLIALVLFALRAGRLTAASRLSGLFCGVVLLAHPLDRLFGGIIWSSLLVRRLILLAGLNTAYYYDYFQTHPFAHYGHGVLGFFGTGGSSLILPNQIGAAYYGSSTVAANANLWADAYGNFGFFGVLLATVVLVGFLWVFDSVAVNREHKLATLLLAVPALNLSNSALQTCLLTHGMALSLLVIILLPPEAERRATAPEQRIPARTSLQVSERLRSDH